MIQDVPLVSNNLASIVIESALYGIFLLLSVLSVYAILKTDGRLTHPSGHFGNSKLVTFASFRRTLKRPMFMGGIALIGTVTGHWVCGIIRLFLAVLNFEDPSRLYSEFAHPTEAAKVAHQMASLVLGDSIMTNDNLKNLSSISANESGRRYPALNEDGINAPHAYPPHNIPPVAVKINRIVEHEDPRMSGKGETWI
ncbi:hypothetical protein PM082_024137 [Marasmius tenuissimus]|nr:hypothetical protein PM082_024137 [Marasmius tenuissimus]